MDDWDDDDGGPGGPVSLASLGAVRIEVLRGPMGEDEAKEQVLDIVSWLIDDPEEDDLDLARRKIDEALAGVLPGHRCEVYGFGEKAVVAVAGPRFGFRVTITADYADIEDT